MKPLVLGLLACAAAWQASAEPKAVAGRGQESYAQHLAAAAARTPGVSGVAFYVAPSKGAASQPIASSLKGGAAAGPAPALESGRAQVTRGAAGADVRLPLLDTSKRRLGVLQVRLTAAKGEADDALIRRATRVRDHLARRISHVDNLLEPTRFDASTPTNSYVQHLVDQAFDAHPEVIILMAHVTPEGAPSAANVVLGSTIGRIGKKADEDDLKVIDGAITKLEVNDAADRFEVEEPLLNTAGERIGALGVVFPYAKGQDTKAYEATAKAIQADLARHILNNNDAFEPYPYDPKYRADTYAQALVDATMRAHPDLRVLALHATPPGSKQNVIIASNIGRIGKKADEDDLAIINTEKTIVEINKTGALIEVALVARDAAGRKIGALGTVYPYKPGDDKAAREREAIQIRDELARQIPTNAALFKPAH
jgi:hypothetical protein